MYNYLNSFGYEPSKKEDPREVANLYTDCYTWCPWW